jgi:hypothetical protein
LLRQEIIQKEIQNHRDKIAKKDSEQEDKLKELETAQIGDVDGAVTAGDIAAGDSGALKASSIAHVVGAVDPVKIENVWKSVDSQKEDGSNCNSDSEGDSLDLDTSSVGPDDDDKYGEEEKDAYGSDLNQMFSQITAESVAMSLQLNVNCFIDGFECDADPAVALKDEELARNLASFLYKQVTVSITEQVTHTPTMWRRTSKLNSSYSTIPPCPHCLTRYQHTHLLSAPRTFISTTRSVWVTCPLLTTEAWWRSCTHTGSTCATWVTWHP